MNEELSADARQEIRELFRARLGERLAGLGVPEDPAELEHLTLVTLLHFQDVGAPEGVAEDAIGELEARGDEAAAAILATAELLLAPTVADPAGAALERLRAKGIEAELPAGTGDLQVVTARRHDLDEADLYLAQLARPGVGRAQGVAMAIDDVEAGGMLVGGTVTEPVDAEQAESLLDYPAELAEGDTGVAISADELHAALRDALARNRELELELPHEIGLGLPLIWRAVGGEAAALEGLSVLPAGAAPHDDPEDEGAPELLDELVQAAPPPSTALPYIALEVGRNEPCPCGSGAKAKRCCLPRTEALRRQVAAVEDLVMELADQSWERCPSCYDRAFAELFEGGSDLFGHATARLRDRLEAALWIVCEGELCEGPPPLHRHLSASAEDAATSALSASQIRVWRLEHLREAGLIEARCALGGSRAELETVRPPTGEAAPGRILVARSVPRPDGRFALLGHPPVVEEEAHADFERLLEEVGSGSAEPAEVGRHHGLILLRAAWCWMEEREHTIEGEQVADRHLAFSLGDAPAAVTALEADPEVERSGDFDDGDTLAWDLRGGGRPASPPPMPAERGVRWVLCEEDRRDPPVRAQIEVDLKEGEIWLFAPSESRIRVAERELRSRLGPLLGEERHRHLDVPDVARRWQRESMERVLAEL